MEKESRSGKPVHSVVFLTYKRHDLISERLVEIRRVVLAHPSIEIIVFDNGSTDPQMRLALASQAAASALGSALRIVRVEKNLGFGGGFNEAVKHAQGEIIHLISDDVKIFGDFIARIDGVADDRPDDPIWMAGQKLVVKGGWNQFGDHVVPYLMGYYLAMTRLGWDELGGFDSATFDEYDFEDVDLGYRASLHGFEFVELDLPLLHAVGGTIEYGTARFEHTVEMRARFAHKWELPNVPIRP